MQRTRLPFLLAAGALAGLLGGCASSEPPLPMVHYPVTYELPSHATQDVAVEAGKPLYYKIHSPVPVTVYLYEKVGAAPGANLLGHVSVASGQTVTERIVPPTSSVEFLFAGGDTSRLGTLQLSLSDEPLAGGPDHAPATFIGH